MRDEAADGSVVDAVLTASRTLAGLVTRSLGAAAEHAEHTAIAQYRALVVLASGGPQRLADLADALDPAPSISAVRRGSRRDPDRLWPPVAADEAPPLPGGTRSRHTRAGQARTREGC